ncbi:putative membrane protein YhhN [Cellulophaga sp. RHA_52]|uniref:lysoplasmalogenase n=1 Tax=Cellulophaga sp. RHA_52 TaxID=1250036 RepID=UPI001199AAAB|nr:lysoplasmalogenase [Cellulophaga sp. RHA_52]TVZ08959.1 putative membrane protein YhhN [Cellulophaga sp. RHA_52]
MGKKILNVAILISAFAAIYSQYVKNLELYNYLKPLTTILIIAVVVVFGKRKPKKYFITVLTALLFCLLGDTLLLNNNYFIYGLASFLVAHILFAYSFISLNGINLNIRPLVVLLTTGIAYYSFIYKGLGELVIVVGVYILFILFMCWQGINLYIKHKGGVFLAIAIAVSLFLISDAILAYNKFVQAFNYSGVLILLTYWLAIGIIANSTMYLKNTK